MRLIKIVLLMTLFTTHLSFAAPAPSSKQCEPIANACLYAKFSEKNTTGKNFWYDCMRPILLGKSVKDVNVDPKDVTACRTFKIMDLQNLLKELQEVN
jgi:hypothetical protein